MAFSDQIKSLQEQIQGFDVSELSADNIGSWPIFIKFIVWLVVFVALIFGGFKFVISDLQVAKASAIDKEVELKKEFESKAFQAAYLDAYRKQMEEMKESFDALISQLPSDTEVPGLLEDITNKGSNSGLVFTSIDLKPEITQEFYIELPIQIVATGTYHDMGAFVSGVSSLPRIVTLSAFSIKPKGKQGDSSDLELTITASTYRYKDLNAAASAKDKGAKKK